MVAKTVTAICAVALALVSGADIAHCKRNDHHHHEAEHRHDGNAQHVWQFQWDWQWPFSSAASTSPAMSRSKYATNNILEELQAQGQFTKLVELIKENDALVQALTASNADVSFSVNSHCKRFIPITLLNAYAS